MNQVGCCNNCGVFEDLEMEDCELAAKRQPAEAPSACV